MLTPDPIAAFRLDERVAVVTGASSGLGARFARGLDAAGARVVVAARRRDRLDALADELEDAFSVACDLSDAGAPAALVKATLDRFGRIDIVVNNAGVDHVEPAIDQSIDDFRRELDVNLVAPFELARHAARAMNDAGQPGSIVNIGSV